MSAIARPRDITRAIGDLEDVFSGQLVIEADDGSGMIVRLLGVELGPRWSPGKGDLWFLLPFHYPDAAIYPYYVTGAIPTEYISGLQPVQWRAMDATQVSLRHNDWNPKVDTALGSVRQTLAWLRSN